MAEIISLLGAEKFLKKAGAKRVSAKAAEEFAELLEHVGLLLAREVVDVAAHAERITIKDDDVKFVMRRKIKDINF